MSFRSESSSIENDENLIEVQAEDVPAISAEGYYAEEENMSLDDYFNDGFGDKENMPSHIMLENEDDIRAIENTYNIDINSLLEKNDLAA